LRETSTLIRLLQRRCRKGGFGKGSKNARSPARGNSDLPRELFPWKPDYELAEKGKVGNHRWDDLYGQGKKGKVERVREKMGKKKFTDWAGMKGRTASQGIGPPKPFAYSLTIM